MLQKNGISNFFPLEKNIHIIYYNFNIDTNGTNISHRKDIPCLIIILNILKRHFRLLTTWPVSTIQNWLSNITASVPISISVALNYKVAELFNIELK